MGLICAGLALLLDHRWGELSRWHPLAGFGWLADAVERRFNRPGSRPWPGLRLRGSLCVILLTGGSVLVGASVQHGLNAIHPLLCAAAAILILYGCIGWRSLAEHAAAVAGPLEDGDLDAGRNAVAKLVSRDVGQLDEAGIAGATVESVLENSSDALLATLFWFAVAGVPGALLHRAANTLDAMWGYRNARFGQFGWAAAKLDDMLAFLPARLTAFAFVVAGGWRESGNKHGPGSGGTAWRCWRRQARHWDSPNAGPVRAAGAGALGIRLGGPARYGGAIKSRPELGQGVMPDVAAIGRALRLVKRAVMLWLFGWAILELLLMLAP